MATAGEGASAPTSSTYEVGGGGGGGKFSKRQYRKVRTTPYDRPPTALRNPSWLSKLVVEPATKLISSSAQRLFASVFRKRLPPPPPPRPLPELNQEASDGLQGAVQKGKIPETIHLDGKNIASDATGSISELEQLLQQKTFSRSEIDRLTELLRSKAVDPPFENDTRENPPEVAREIGNHELLKSPLVENKTKKERSHGIVSTPGTNATVLDEDIVSPAELAKAYMGSRSLKVSPSILSLRGQAIKQDTSLLNTVPFTPKSPMMTTKTAAPLDVSENGFTTPRFRGRSAIYNMARTPYSRVHSTAFGKGISSRSLGHDGNSFPLSTLQGDGDLGPNKMVLKRRSSVLDDDVGSVGPIRRIRQKHSLLPHKFTALTYGTGVSDAAQRGSRAMENLRQENLKIVEEIDYGTPSTSYDRVPPKSVETAAKIFQELERMTPREKSAEFKLVAAREKSPAKLTAEMLRGPALRSLEEAEPLKLLQNIQDSQRLEGEHHGSTSQGQVIQENGPRKFDFQHITTPPATSNPTTSAKDVMPGAEAASATISLDQHPQKKKRAFKMSAPEDSLELDDDTYCNGTVSQTLVEGSRKFENYVIDKNSAPVEKQEKDQIPALTEIKRTPPEPLSGRTDAGSGNTTTVGGESAAVVSRTLHMSNLASQSAIHSPIASAFEKPGQAFDKIPTIETSRSTSSIQGTELPLEVPPMGKQDDNSQVATKPKAKPETVPSIFGSSSFGSMFSSTITENQYIKNGPLAIGPPLFASSPTAASTSLANQLATDSTNTVPSMSNTASAAPMWASATSSSSSFLSTPVPTLSAAPVSESGSSHDASTAASSVLSAPNIEASVAKRKLDKEAKSSSFNHSLSSDAALVITNTENSIFGLKSSNSSSAATGAPPPLQSFMGGSGTASFAQSIPVQFTSSTPAFIFGSQAFASSGSSNSQFCSSTPATLSETKPLSSGSGASSRAFSFGPTSTPTSEASPVGSTSGATTSTLKFGASSSAASSATATSPPTSEASPVGSTSGATTSTLKFGASSSAASSATATVISTGFSNPGIFNFGAVSSSGNSMVSSNTGASSSILGTTTVLSSPSLTNAASSSSAPSTVFGSSWQSPKSSPFGGTFNSSPSTFFSPGASTSSFSAANSAPMFFGSTTIASSAPVFSFSTAPTPISSSPSPFPTQPLFGNSTSTLSTPAGNNDHMSTEDSMAEDPVQSTAPVTPVFGQQPVPSSPFAFNTSWQSSPFQFGAQQNQGAPQSPSPFQASSSLDYAGGSFSLGSIGAGGDKSGRKFIKANRNKHRKR